MNSGQLKKANIRGLPTAWIECPNPTKPILFLLHGYPDAPDTFSDQVDPLKEHFHLILPYARGVGPSAPGRGYRRSSVDAVCLDLHHILHETRPKDQGSVYLVGHDLGAFYAWAFAETLGDRLGGLTMIGGLGLPQAVRRFKSSQQLLKSWYIFAMQVPKAPELILRNFKGSFLKLAYRLGHLQPQLQPKVLDHASLESVVVNPVSHYRALMRDAIQEYARAPRRIQGPVLVINGNKDAFVAQPTLGEMEPFADEVSIRIMEGNHWIHRENSTLVNKAILDFYA